MSLLAFSTPGLESAFVRRRNAQLLRNDAAWALFWLMFGGAGIGKAAMQPWGRQTWQEIAAICAYMAWSPLLLWLINRRTDFYLRHRSAVLVAMRIVRTTLLMQHMDQRQTLWVGAAGSPPGTVLMVYVHLCHKINFLLLTSVGVLLPMRLHLPLHLVFFLLMLRATAQRCRAECDVAHAAAGALGGTPAFQPYYKLVLKWLRRVTPRPPWRLPPSWRPAAVPAGGCLASCYTAHAFLQAVGGVLFPLGLLWFLA
ncbi:hypothetical protein C2E21_3771 [Chlorella sorokiniana]|uniref:Uncharacterized protein n=1 Tax=Chlorella sorokiniana TaxID=3076 RepID=A0A2P6TU30_CHLSO|nr:hypothetical protein C2E21_3771 [Chlorella sorokiniana]|eukprot:PRW57582.1 hypothetical protein C2E21_3771 [Chlorella sorokiniana]